MAITCAQCASELIEGSSVCTHCGATVVSLAVPSIEVPDSTPLPSEVPMFSTGSDLEGIGGWLIPTAIGLGVAPFILLKGIYSDLVVLYGDRFQVGLSQKPGLAALILFESVSNSIFLLAMVSLNVLFYRKKRAFPGWMIAYLAINSTLILLDNLFALRYSPHAQMTGVIRTVVGSLIWIPYYLRSERVRVTFVN